MKNHSQWIYLLTSNSHIKYISDALETLSLPSGTVQHFRYQMKWLGDSLQKEIPEEESKDNRLKGTRMVICYLYQKKNEQGNWTWNSIYPIRIAVLKDVYKTGSGETDPVHFYFGIEDYISYDEEEKFLSKFIDKIKSKHEEKEEYAFLEESLDNKYTNRKESPFRTICNALNAGGAFKSPKGDTEYYPVFCSVKGLKGPKGGIVKPKYDYFVHKSYYEIDEGRRYALEFDTYFPQDPPKFTIEISSPAKEVFSTPSKDTFDVTSRYDKMSFLLVSRLLYRDVWTHIKFATNLGESPNGKTPLNLEIKFLMKVKRNAKYRIANVAANVIFSILTVAVSITFPTYLRKWEYWLIIIGIYTIWVVIKIRIVFWGKIKKEEL